MALELLKKTDAKKGFFAIEKIGLLYTLFTSVVIILLFHRMERPLGMLFERLIIVVAMVLLVWIYRQYACKLTTFLRTAFQMGLLAYWYPDTYEFNRLFPNLDHLFASCEQVIFHCQPAILFSQYCSSAWFCEAFNLGYFSYYPMIFGIALFYFFCRYREFDKVAFVLVTSFFVYYLIYLFLPVAGPQYYFPAIGLDQVAQAHFPAIGDYFNYHAELLPAKEPDWGIFYKLVEMSQQAGERPTAAFPSSHVGMSTIILLLAFRAKKFLFWCLMPFYVLLCCATVYIQAHYLIDAIAGFFTAFLIYAFAMWLYGRMVRVG